MVGREDLLDCSGVKKELDLVEDPKLEDEFLLFISVRFIHLGTSLAKSSPWSSWSSLLRVSRKADKRFFAVPAVLRRLRSGVGGRHHGSESLPSRSSGLELPTGDKSSCV